MKKLPVIWAAVLSLALVAFLFSACGGEDQTAATPTVAVKTTAKAGSSTTKPESLIGQPIVATDQSPKNFQSSLGSRRPIVVTFYMTGPSDDNQVRSSIQTLESRYRGQVDFEDYLFSDGDKYGDLPTLLKINSTPSVVMINKQSRVQRAWTGFVDQSSLEQGISEINNS